MGHSTLEPELYKPLRRLLVRDGRQRKGVMRRGRCEKSGVRSQKNYVAHQKQKATPKSGLLSEFGARGRTRTDTVIHRRILNPLRLPISPPGHARRDFSATGYCAGGIIQIPIGSANGFFHYLNRLMIKSSARSLQDHTRLEVD